MRDNAASQTKRKKTPADATPFERDQLRFFLSNGNLASTLFEINPSLAWLPFLWEAKLVESDTQLVAWLERNFADREAVRDVATNINFFGPETAAFLEFRLNAQAEPLSPVLKKSWALILRHIRSTPRGMAQNDWFEILPSIKRGDHSADVLERLSNALRPKLRIGKRLSWYNDDGHGPIERPTDLMSINYEVIGGVSAKDVIDAWPTTRPAEGDEELLRYLTIALGTALSDATDAGVEGNEGYSISDTDVPSVAPHGQNAYRTGFQTIVRVTADVWTRLASKSPTKALEYAKLWRGSPFRLTRRLGAFAFANRATPGSDAADTLINMPAGELFLTNSSVEAYRLIRERWNDFPPRKRSAILDRLVEGPPRTWFRSEADVDRYIDHARYDFLADMDRRNVNIGREAKRTLSEIRARWPQWRPKPTEQIGFHVWHESGLRNRENSTEPLKGAPDDQIVGRAREAAAVSPFRHGDIWHNLCVSDPDRAVRALDAAARSGDWPKGFWEQALWSRTAYSDSDTKTRIAQLLLGCPWANFEPIAAAASSWLEVQAKTLPEGFVWELWDRIADAVLVGSDETDPLKDAFNTALNSPSGRLAEILIHKIGAGSDGDFPADVRERLDRLFGAPGRAGLLAMVRIARDIPFFFHRAPSWTAANIIPLFDWSRPHAGDIWSARIYSEYIGPPELFELFKNSFLQLFGRTDVPTETLGTFSVWIVSILIANQADNSGYPLSDIEARSALRRAGPAVLPKVANRLALELEGAASEQKISCWRNVVGVVFHGIWPLDIELQTSAATFELVRLLLSSGNSFGEVADAILPFVQADEPRSRTTVYSIAGAPEDLYRIAPQKLLDVVAAIVGDATPGSVYALSTVLDRLSAIDPKISDKRQFQKLLALASSYG